MINTGNPIFSHKFTSDPTVLLYDQKVYLYTGHDEAPPGVQNYIMRNWLCFSSADLINWEEHPIPLQAKDFSWASGDAFASCVVFNKQQFYWFAAVSHRDIPGKAIALGVSKTPTGPFRDAIGSALITGDDIPFDKNPMANLDPSVIIDTDGQAYIFWGNQQCYFAKLSDDMLSLQDKINTIELPGFSEGAHVFKRNDWYYLTYGYGSPEKVAYAMSPSIHGPWVFKGILNELAGNCETNRPAILEFKGKNYFFYHNGALKGGGSHRRSVCVDYLYYNPDGTIKRVLMTSEGLG